MDRSEIRRKFGQALRDVLAAQNRSQSDLAEALGISQSAVTNWILGRKEPQDFWMVFEIERALRVTPGTFSRILGFCPCDHGSTSVELAILDADHLPDRARQALLANYQVWSELSSSR